MDTFEGEQLRAEVSISNILEPSFRRLAFIAAAAAVILLFTGVPVCAQLQVTEVMFDPLDEDVWEWIEVRNMGLSPVDLHGAYGDRLGDPRILPSDPPSIDNAKAFNTVIPTGGVAVLYDANLPLDGTDSEDQVFYEAWGLTGSETLIGVDFFPTLINSGSSIGFWEDYADYALDLVDPGSGNLEVGSFDNALFGIDFRSGFPVVPNGTSMRFNGQGSYQSGVNWTLSASGVDGAVTSVPASVLGPINNTSDIASPGLQSGGSWPALIITELMVNPASDIPDWQWIEVYNGGMPIDFTATNYVLDDDDGDDLLAANITSGSIGVGETAVLYNGDALSLQNMQEAWDPNSNGTNFISVTDFSTLETSSETVALWGSHAAYLAEPTTGPGRSTDNAVTVLDYDDDGSNWPSFNGVSSNYLTDLDADPNDDFFGDFWAQSALDDPNFPAFHASEAMGGVEVHAGGDIGSPGVFEMTAPNDADFDDDNDVDGIDFLILQRGLGVGSNHATGDANGDNVVDEADLAIWEIQYGTNLFSVISDADFDNDNDVDGEDFLIWQRGLGIGSSHAAGDANGDGLVNAADLAVWEAQYGTPPPLGTSSAVPEPASIVLVVLALSGWPRFSRRRGRR